MNKKMSRQFNIVTTTADWVMWIWKLCLNLCWQSWFKPSLNRVNNLTLLGVISVEETASRRTHEFRKCFLHMFKLSELQLFSSNLLHPIIVTRKKEFRKSFCLILNVIIVLVSLVLHILTKVGILLNRSIALIVLLNMRLDVLGFPT